MRGTRVEHEDVAPAEHRHDVLVEGSVPAHEHAIADLGPRAAHAGDRNGPRRGGVL
jgi:hypothetical protein